MIYPYQPATEVDEPSEARQPDKRPPLTVIAAIVFAIISFYLLMIGSMVESFGTFLVSIACQAVGKEW